MFVRQIFYKLLSKFFVIQPLPEHNNYSSILCLLVKVVQSFFCLNIELLNLKEFVYIIVCSQEQGQVVSASPLYKQMMPYYSSFLLGRFM